MKLPTEDLKRALTLIRDLQRLQRILRIDPIAMRVALKYLILCDDLFAPRNLTPELNVEIDAYAHLLLAKTRGELIDLSR